MSDFLKNLESRLKFHKSVKVKQSFFDVFRGEDSFRDHSGVSR